MKDASINLADTAFIGFKGQPGYLAIVFECEDVFLSV